MASDGLVSLFVDLLTFAHCGWAARAASARPRAHGLVSWTCLSLGWPRGAHLAWDSHPRWAHWVQVHTGQRARSLTGVSGLPPCPRSLGDAVRHCSGEKGWLPAELFNCTTVSFLELKATVGPGSGSAAGSHWPECPGRARLLFPSGPALRLGLHTTGLPIPARRPRPRPSSLPLPGCLFPALSGPTVPPLWCQSFPPTSLLGFGVFKFLPEKFLRERTRFSESQEGAKQLQWAYKCLLCSLFPEREAEPERDADGRRPVCAAGQGAEERHAPPRAALRQRRAHGLPAAGPRPAARERPPGLRAGGHAGRRLPPGDGVRRAAPGGPRGPVGLEGSGGPVLSCATSLLPKSSGQNFTLHPGRASVVTGILGASARGVWARTRVGHGLGGGDSQRH